MTTASALFPRRLVVVWAVLVLLTVLSWWLSSDGAELHASRLVGGLAILIAFVKVSLVGNHFMELRRAPRSLRSLFEGWCVAVGAMTVIMYVVA
jgi:heme/copper-type cytochrome/quinol oxidase subunit 4